MAKQCTRCGKDLPRDDARFCNNCGKIVPYSHPIKRSLPDEPPAWMKQLEDSVSNAPLHGLHVNVWDQHETVDLPKSEEEVDSDRDDRDVVDDLPTDHLSVADIPGTTRQALSMPNHTTINAGDEGIVEDLPTNPLIASLPKIPPAQLSSTPAPSTISKGRVSNLNDVEELDTRPLMAQRQGQTVSSAVENQAAKPWQASQTPAEPGHSSVLQGPVTPVLFAQPQIAPAQALRQTPPVSIAVTPDAQTTGKSRKRLVAAAILLFILVAGGVSAWLFVFRPFAVPEITKTTQSFQNADLGVSLNYPVQWTEEVDKKSGTIYFYDDNHTDQVKINVVNTSGLSIGQFINKEAGSLGMTGQKAGVSLSFAGVSWQQLQGNMQQSGASYSADLLVTIHGGRYYAILQLAPASTYFQEDQLVFSSMRSSFKFI